MKPVKQVSCDCSMSKAGMIEHSLRLCAVVLQRRAVLKLYSRATPGWVAQRRAARAA